MPGYNRPSVGKWASWLCRLMVAVLLLGTEAHLCMPEFTKADGAPCTTCQTLQDRPANHDEVAAAHGDCHDCCVIKPCDDHKPPQPAAAANVLDWQAVAAPALSFTLPVAAPVDPPANRDAAPYLATGPPSATAPRAPPAS